MKEDLKNIKKRFLYNDIFSLFITTHFNSLKKDYEIITEIEKRVLYNKN
jgi:hypothetical protein